MELFKFDGKPKICQITKLKPLPNKPHIQYIMCVKLIIAYSTGTVTHVRVNIHANDQAKSFESSKFT